MKSIEIDMTNSVFGFLTVIERDRSPRNDTRAYWKCKCKCGNDKIVMGKHLRTGSIASCGCIRSQPSTRYTGKGDISGAYWSGVKYKANVREIEFNLDIEYAWDLFQLQDGKCALSGMPLHLVRYYKKHRDKQTASLDRIDNTKGYIEGNVQWVHKWLNVMRNELSIQDFINTCKLVAEHAGKSH